MLRVTPVPIEVLDESKYMYQEVCICVGSSKDGC